MMSYAPGVTDTPLRALSPLSFFTQVDLFYFFSVERMDVRFGELIGAGPGAYTETVGLKWLSFFFWLKKTFYFT